MLAKLAPAPTYALDELAAEHGHEILRTPPYHPELQPIETCWAVVKNQIARKNKCTMAQISWSNLMMPSQVLPRKLAQD